MKQQMWIPSNGINLEEAAMDAVRCDKNTLVIAGPGAGKTELLAQKAGFLFTTNTCRFPKHILAISFKKDAAENLKKRIIDRYGDEYKDRFISLTYDAFFKSILDKFYRVLPEEYSLNSNYIIVDSDDIIRKVLRIAGCTDLDNMKDCYGKKYAANLVEETEIPTSDVVLKKFWQIMLQGDEEVKPGLSFTMVAKLSLLIVKTNPYIKKIICSTYSHVFLDEFQDTTELQYRIVKELFENTNIKITAVGDNKQRIMLWAGAKNNVFDVYCNSFSASEFRLIKNHRSAPRLIELQKKMYKSLQDNYTQINYSDKWENDDGIIQLLISNDEQLEAYKVAEMISEDIKNGTPYNEISIICKQKVADYTNDIITCLQEKGIRARIEMEYQDLIKDDLIMIYLDCIMLSCDRKNTESYNNIRSFILMLYSELDYSQEKYNSIIRKVDDFLNNIYDSLLEIKTLKQFKVVIEKIVSHFGKDNIKSIFPQYQQGTFFDDQTEKFSKLLWKEYEKNNYSWKDSVLGFLGEKSIPIMTIHKSKGLEYSSVYFVGLEDDAFWNFEKQPEEDRCVFFVALSRAKRKIVFTFSKRRRSFMYPEQKNKKINEFYELLKNPGCDEIIEV